MTRQRPDSIAVIGAGIIGSACACALARAGHDVVLLDAARQPVSASMGNAGHLATEQIEPLASPRALRSAPSRMFRFGGALDVCGADVATWLPWALRCATYCTARHADAGRRALSALLCDALPAWRRLAAALGRPDLIVDRGHLLLWETESSAAAGRRAWNAAETGTATFGDVDPALMRHVRGTLNAPIADGIAFRQTGQVSDPRAVLERLQAAFVEAGGQRRFDAVARLQPGSDRPQAVLDTGDTVRVGCIVVAAGVDSGRLMRGAGHVAPVIAERGYHIEAAADGWPGLPPVVFEDRSMIVTRFGDRLRAASFVEFGAAATPPDPRKWQRLHRHAAELGLPMRGPVTQWMGARPTLPDYLPAIGVSRRMRNVAYAFGHQHLGLTLAAITAEVVVDLVAGRSGAVDPTPYDLSRFERRPT